VLDDCVGVIAVAIGVGVVVPGIGVIVPDVCASRWDIAGIACDPQGLGAVPVAAFISDVGTCADGIDKDGWALGMGFGSGLGALICPCVSVGGSCPCAPACLDARKILVFLRNVLESFEA